MKKAFLRAVIMGGAIAASALGLSARDKHGPTPPPLPSQTQTHLRIDVKDETNELHIIQDDNDPDIVTKAYVLKHADPYELRPYLRMAVRSERIRGDRAKVETIRYNDGTSILLVSAEEYRFGKQEVGMGFDEIIELFDIPKITSSSGDVSFAYFPKYNDARWLGDKVRRVGMNVSTDDVELTGGGDRVVVDNGINGLLFRVPAYSRKNISTMLRSFDLPAPEVRVRYTVYELNHENDGMIGVDFQAWKNGPGRDILTAAYRFTDGWDPRGGIVANQLVHDTRTQFFRFSPRWNTKFLDFLAAKGRASVITSGELSIMNNTEGRVEAMTRVPGFRDGAKIANIETFGYFQLTDARIYNAYTGVIADSDVLNMGDGRFAGRFRFRATDERGNLVSISMPNVAAAPDPVSHADAVYRGDMTITRVFDGTRHYFGITLDADSAARQGVQFVRQRRDGAAGNVQQFERLGHRVEGLFSVRLEESVAIPMGPTSAPDDDVVYRYEWRDVSIAYRTDQSFTIFRDVARVTHVDGYGFVLSMVPSVSDETTVMDMHMVNTSLMGFTDTGAPRTARSEIQNRFMISNKGGRLVVGGVDKQAVVRSVSKVPYIGDLPILGWLLSSESQVTKRSQIVAVLDCEAVMPETAVPEDVSSEISGVRTRLEDAGKSNTYGFDQFLLDPDKKSFDPLP